MSSMVVRHYRKTLALSGTAQRIFEGAETNGHQDHTNDVIITALAANAGSIFIGDSTVDNTARPLIPGASVNFSVNPMADDYFKMSNMFIDGSATGDIVIVTYLTRTNA